jgi:hypothetical protein
MCFQCIFHCDYTAKINDIWTKNEINNNNNHNSKHYIHSIFINTYDNYPCLLQNIPDVDQTSVKLDFSISYKESGFKIITIDWNIAISCIYEWIKCAQKEKKYWGMIDFT